MDALEEGIDILRERRVDRMIRDKQELLRTEKEVDVVTGLLTEIQVLNEAKAGIGQADRAGGGGLTHGPPLAFAPQ
ncbi:MAG: hypothetical protein IPK99_17825 [Flavobacteriales bacterium]|nr:hypothetical protein [Flavobacteriales bacterium]